TSGRFEGPATDHIWCQGPNQKWPRNHQRYDLRAHAELGRAECGGCRCWQIEGGADTPDQTGRIGWGKEKALVDIAKTGMGAAELAKLKGFGRKGCKTWLIDQRGDCAADNVPIAERNGNYRLDVEHVSSGVMVRTNLTIDVVLNRQADHRSYRVLRGL